MSRQTPVLECAACGHQNEPERVYCHNCGQKLDRSLLPKVQESNVESDLEKRRRVKKLMSGTRKNPIARELKTLFSVLIFAALVAAIFLLFNKPEDVPPRKFETFPERDAGEVLNALIADKRPLATDLNETEINYFLSKALKPADSGVPGVKFERAFVNLRPGMIIVTVERSLFGEVSIFNSTIYAPRVADGNVKFEPIGIYFGRLGLDPRMTFAPGLGLDGVKKAFEKELAGLGRLTDVQVGNKTVKLITKAAP